MFKFKRFGKETTNKPAACFKTDLVRGQQYEDEFQKRFPALVIKNTTKSFDFILPTSESLELKTDTYTTNNFFFERYSDVAAKTPGSVWQSDEKHVDYFCYWFINQERFFLFETSALKIFLEKYVSENNPKLIEVKNKGYSSAGYLVPISKILASGLCLSIEDEFLTEKENQIKNAIDA